MLRLINSVIRNRSGATAIEYGLIAALISLLLIAGATTAGEQLESVFDAVSTSLTGAADGLGSGEEGTPAE